VQLEKQSHGLVLGDNHFRVISAVLRRVETTCDEVIWWLERPAGDLHLFAEDVTPSQAQSLRALVAQLRQELRDVQKELYVSASVQSRVRGIAASLSLTRTELEEVLTPGLRGYGALPPQTEAALDRVFTRLLLALQALNDAVERGQSRDTL
jgi:hypothetical protein